jgi:hypothetical protein
MELLADVVSRFSLFTCTWRQLRSQRHTENETGWVSAPTLPIPLPSYKESKQDAEKDSTKQKNGGIR